MFNSRRRLVLICVGLFGIACVFGGDPVYYGVPSYITKAEDFPINGTLFNFTATDTDNDDITVGYGDPATLDLVDIRRHCNSTCNHIFVEVKLRTSLDFDNKAFPNPATIKLTLTDLQFNRINVQLSVYITDVNDNSPEFNNQPYTWSIPERPFENNTYTQISTTDKDSVTNRFVTYDLQPTAQSSVMNRIYSETFSMDKTTGTVTLLKQLDYETNTFYPFKVIAVDGGGRNSTTDFIVRVRDAQDTAPYFTEIPYRASIHENSNTWVLNVSAVDGDHGIPSTVSYSIKHGSCSSLFEIGNIDSKGVIHTRQQIDRDSGVVLDESGVCILQVLAEERNASGIPQYGKTTATTNVTIIIEDENDNSPTFDNDVYTARVRENTVQDVPITLNDPKRITVHDKDQQTEYSKIKLSVRYPNMTVCYDFVPVPDEIQGSGSAMILVNNTELLDFEVIQDITFLIIATESANASHVATATVSLSLIDVNDNNPKFEKSTFVFHVNESSENGTYVNTITATDADSNSDISYSISGGNDRFIVDSKSGQIAVNCKNCLDDLNREVIAVYYMMYTATDSGKRSTSVPLVINLDDINDNTPTFLRDNCNAFVWENDIMSLTTPLVTVSATDKDLSTNGNVTYDIMTVSPSDMKDNLTINATSGYLFLKSVLDFERLGSVSGSFNVTVKAEDSGHPPRSSNTTVIITVQDKNDNSPVFNQTRFCASVLENSTSSPTEHFHVSTMAAYDLDGTEINRELRYFIVEGAYERFSIDSSNGTVYVHINAKLDREKLDNYNITIIAIDQGSPSLTGTTTLSVDILDVNDEDPSFNQTSFTAAVFENTNNSIGASVTTCFARDPDENNTLNYSIIKVKGKDKAGNKVDTTLINDYFGIKENNGTVYINSVIDRETAQTVTLTVQVEDMNAYNPKPQTATASLTITLKDVNDNYPATNCSTQNNCNNGSCSTLPGNYHCACYAGYTGSHCTDDIDECSHSPCHHDAICVNTFGSYQCRCATGYTGYNCAVDLDECTINPCINNGICKNIPGSFLCLCSGFYGEHCEHDVDECSRNPCKNNGSCVNTYGSFTCKCLAGFLGNTCDVNLFEYASSTNCKNGGTSTKIQNGQLVCNCRQGFTGDLCENGVDACASQPCHHGGTCVIHLNAYKCYCIAGYTAIIADMTTMNVPNTLVQTEERVRIREAVTRANVLMALVGMTVQTKQVLFLLH